MLMARIEGATRELGKPVDWPEGKPCMTLPIKDVDLDTGDHVMGSAWQPDPAELGRLKAGAHVILWVFGRGHPPVSLMVGPQPQTGSDFESIKGVMWYSDVDGALMCDKEVPGSRKIEEGYFVAESMTASMARLIAQSMGYGFKETG